MNILLIDGGKAFGHSAGRLNHTLHQTARSALQAQGHQTRETVIDEGYDLPQEVDKFLWMDAVIWQMPGWWMGPPWTVKKYMDEVFTAGAGMLFSNDGRSSASPTAVTSASSNNSGGNMMPWLGYGLIGGGVVLAALIIFFNIRRKS